MKVIAFTAIVAAVLIGADRMAGRGWWSVAYAAGVVAAAMLFDRWLERPRRDLVVFERRERERARRAA